MSTKIISKKHVSDTWRFWYQYDNHWDQTHKFLLKNSEGSSQTLIRKTELLSVWLKSTMTFHHWNWLKMKNMDKIETYTEQVVTWNVNVIACRRGTDRVVLVQVVATGRVVGLGRTTTTEWRAGPLKAAPSHQQIHMLQAPHSRF